MFRLGDFFNYKTRMFFGALAIILIASILIGNSMRAEADEIADGNQILYPFGEEKIRYILWNAPQNLRDEFVRLGNSEIFDHTYTPKGYSDADAIIFFIDGWDDIWNVPGADKLGSVVRSKANNLSDITISTSLLTAITKNKKRTVSFAFINLNNADECELKYAILELINRYQTLKHTKAKTHKAFIEGLQLDGIKNTYDCK